MALGPRPCASRWPASAGRSAAPSPSPAAPSGRRVVVVAEIGDGTHTGRGECVPYARYGESVEGVVAAIEGCRAALAQGLDRAGLAALLPAGAARNALDCALWDLEAKRPGEAPRRSPGFRRSIRCPRPSPSRSGTLRPWPRRRARREAFPLLKLKLGGAGDRGALGGGARGGAGSAAHRRCERGLASP